MALNVCKLFNSDWGIGITGYAVPVPESANRLFAYYAVTNNKHIVLSNRIDTEKDDPLKVRLTYIAKLLNGKGNTNCRLSKNALWPKLNL